MVIRSIHVLSLVAVFMSQVLGTPAPQQVRDYPAAYAARGEAPGALAVDAQGYTYLTGVLTASSGGHAAGAIYATRIDPSGQTRLYTAYLDASGLQRVTGAAVDSDGNLFVAGYTSSPGFPVIGGIQNRSGGGLDAFVAKLDPKGQSWLYSTLLGGAGDDVANAIAVDQHGNAFVTGSTASTDFPLMNAAQSQRSSGPAGFVAEISADGARLVYASYLGSGTGSSGRGIAVDSTGAAYIAGGGSFFLKTAANSASLDYVRAIDPGTEATSVALDGAGNVYVAGNAGGSVFAAKYGDDGTRIYSTRIAGMDGETAPIITADPLGNAYIASGRSGLLVKLSASGARLDSQALPGTGARAVGLAAMGSGRVIAVGNVSAARVSTCSLWLAQSAQTVGAEGGAASIAVQTTPECDWQAAASAPWLKVSGSAAGNGTLSYRVAPNHGPARTAAVAVGGETVSVTQAAGSPLSAAGAIRDNMGFRAQSLASCDDCSSAQAVDLGFPIDFYGRTYTQVWVNANGNITFDAPSSTYRPEALSTLNGAMIAPFWADADTRRAAGSISYGRDTVDGHPAFGVTWTNIAAYSGRQDNRNSFQLVLIDRSDIASGLFDIEMNYAGLEWDAGEASGRASARAGFTNGTAQAGTWLELTGSGERRSLLDGGQNGLAGRHTFAVRPLSSVSTESDVTAGTTTASTVSANAAIVKAYPHLTAGTITEYPVPISGSQPYGITAGPDGALWFTDWSGFIGRMTTAGTVTEAPDLASNPVSIVTGPDGALWFADTNNSKIGRITTSGAITEFATPTAASSPHEIVSGPDGNLWFTEYSVAKIGRITPGGTITEFALSHNFDQPQGIAVGPDGALWFTESHPSANSIGRITTSGAITEFAIPTASAGAVGIVNGPDNNLWFTEFTANKIGQLTTSGTFTEYPLSTAGSQPFVITPGPDGALWFTQFGSDQIGTITTGGSITEYPIPTAISQPAFIVAGADGAMWFAESHAGKIGRIVTSVTNPPVLSIAKTHTGNFARSQQGATYTVTVSNTGTGATTAPVTVTEMVPAGMSLVSMAGSGWTCSNPGTTCSRSDALPAGSSYSAITVTVNVAYAAATPQVNVVSASGGASASAFASDSTVINLAASLGTIVEYPVPISGSAPHGITAGPDGAMWFTDWSGYIGRMTTGGTVTEAPDAASNPPNIVTGPDGALWFTDATNKIGRISTSGAITEFTIPTAGSGPNFIVVGPDGALWFTEYSTAKIGRITTDGVITEFPLSHNFDQPQGITVGPDGALWFTESHPSANAIGRITTSGTITEYAIPTNSAGAVGIATGPDGNIWFTEYTSNKIGSVTTSGVFKEYPLSSVGSQPNVMILGPDGALWFTQFGTGQVGRITTAGLITEYTIPTAISQPTGIAVGPDGAIWFSESHAGKIGRIVGGITDPPVLNIAKTHTGDFTLGQQGATYAVTVSNASGAGPTSGLVTVTEMAPAGLTLASMAGTGWDCAGVTTCTRSDALPGGSSYPAITVTVNVARFATTPQVNAVSVSGGGSPSAFASDSTVIDSTASVGTITEYPVPISGSAPHGLTAGPDGAMWFTDWSGYIGRLTTFGAITEVPDAASNPPNIVTGPDGALWFTDATDKIGRISTSGAITEYAIPTAGSGPNFIVVGPDGALWFTEFTTAKIGRITTAGVITEFPLSHNFDQPQGITVGPDGALWFTESHPSANAIGRITTSGTITEYAIPTNSAGAVGIATGPDGNIWFTEFTSNKIGSVTPSGVFTEYPLSSAGSQPNVMVLGPDGALWFTQFGTGQIGRITTAGLITEYPIPTAISQPTGIAVGPDGAIWFAESHAGKIGRIATGFTDPPALTIAVSHIGYFQPGQVGATYTVTVSNAIGTGPTSGLVTVTNSTTTGLTLVSMSGTGWNCPTGGTICTRSDSLAPGSSYPAIAVTVNIAGGASSPQVDTVSVSGGGSVPASASDSANVTTLNVGSITEYKSPTTGSQPVRIASGPDGALWYTEQTGNKIARSTTVGTITEFPVPTAASQPIGITVGPDGALWFTEKAGNKIGTVSTGGTFHEFTVTTAASQPTEIVAGPDGNLWFTEFAVGKIGRITTAGTVTEFTLSHNFDEPTGITVGPDGALWFTEFHPSANNIGRITTSGTITEYALPTNSAGAVGITAGPDGALWFAESSGNKIGRITTGGVFQEFGIATAGSAPYEIVTGPDGALWFTQFSSDAIGRMTTSGVLFEYPIPTATSQPTGIVVGPDNQLWFTEFNGNKIGSTVAAGVATPVLSVSSTHSGNFMPGQQGATYSLTVSNTAGAGATNTTVTVTETIPPGLSLVSMAGPGWTCPNGASTCTRADALPSGVTYPPIVVTTNVTATQSEQVVNQVSVTAAALPPSSATDPTTIGAFSPCDVDLSATTTVVDVQLVINQALGIVARANDVNSDGRVDIIDVEIVMIAVLGRGCV